METNYDRISFFGRGIVAASILLFWAGAVILIKVVPHDHPSTAGVLGGIIGLLSTALFYIGMATLLLRAFYIVATLRPLTVMLPTDRTLFVVTIAFIGAALLIGTPWMFVQSDAEFINNLAPVHGIRLGVLWLVFFVIYRASQAILALRRT